ncbi:MAG: efflux RND transporter periplasmic adaptor subunit [Armatimonadetes bacterium]|nr:efflux RND transporter periplasmic adaptor subunit [Armatimonadota bacterium]
MRALKISLLILIPLLLMAYGGWRAMGMLKKPPPPVRNLTVSRGDVSVKVVESGIVQPLKKVEVKSKVGGRILNLAVDEGQSVRTGQLIAYIDKKEIASQVEQIRAQLDAAYARLEQARTGAGYQSSQTQAQIEQAREALSTAEARLAQAREQARVQPSLTRASIAQAQANVASAQDNVRLLEESTHPQAVSQTEANVQENEATLENYARNLERQKQLQAKGFVSQRDVDSAQTQSDVARVRLEESRKRADILKKQIEVELRNARTRLSEAQAALDAARANAVQDGVRRKEYEAARAAVAQARSGLRAAQAGEAQNRMRLQDVQQAQASVAQLKNSLEEAETRLNDTTILAPMNGLVTKKYIEPGELITSGVATFSSGMPIVQVSDLSKMLVKININEVDIARVKVNERVDIKVDAYKGVVFRGRVSKVGSAALGGEAGQPQPSGVIKFPVEIEIAHPDPRLRPGMSAKNEIIVEERKNVVRVPIEGVSFEGKKAFVELVQSAAPGAKPEAKGVKPAETTQRRAVKVGLKSDIHAEILSGLKAGDKVRPAKFKGPARKGADLRMGPPPEEE